MGKIYITLLACMSTTFAQQPHDMVINEILFNPKPGGTDFVEIYNRSENTFDLSNLNISARNTGRQLITTTRISIKEKLLPPKGYCLLTADSLSIVLNHTVIDPASITELVRLPSMPDDKGKLLLITTQGVIIDELHYDEAWHFKLLNNKEGISLERLNANDSTQKETNWHSAASGAGYATPGYANSQRYAADELLSSISIIPERFSPDNNGMDDFAVINYQFSSPGYVMTVTVFNAAGRPVRYLVRNLLCGNKGFFRWDGLNEEHGAMATGIYILLIECLNLEGKSMSVKKAITLVRPP